MTVPITDPIEALQEADWSFATADTLTAPHGLHPYPAKFIPQIPERLIRVLSIEGDTVLDPFCGSGTTLVEALRSGRHALGVDANPLACLIARAKTNQLTARAIAELEALASNCTAPREVSEVTYPFDGADFWFEERVVVELLAIREACYALTDAAARDLALASFSAIIVSVSRQDSDTRYVRRRKDIAPGETTHRFVTTLRRNVEAVASFQVTRKAGIECEIIESDVLVGPPIGRSVDLVVTSPPYPNAYSYHLYHRTRMLWLGYDQARFKSEEIGSHRKYSARGKNRADALVFAREMESVFGWLSRVMRVGAYACFVVGDSKIRGEIVKNNEIIAAAAARSGFELSAQIERPIKLTSRAFAHSRLRTENLLLLRNEGLC